MVSPRCILIGLLQYPGRCLLNMLAVQWEESKWTCSDWDWFGSPRHWSACYSAAFPWPPNYPENPSKLRAQLSVCAALSNKFVISADLWLNSRRNHGRSRLRRLMTAILWQGVHQRGLLVMLLGFFSPIQMTHKDISIWCDSPGGLALRLSGRPKPVHRSLPLPLRGVADVLQRAAGVPSTPLHFTGNKTEWKKKEGKR